jgi:transcriptional regulator with XRE-family HTH domain
MSNAVRLAEEETGEHGTETPFDAAANSLQGREIRFEPGTPVVGGALLAPEQNAGPTRRKAVELSAFFERLRQVLDDRGMSQADLARELGVGVATVSEWFTRGRVPNGDVMLRLPTALNVNGHWLLTGHGPREYEAAPNGDPYARGAADAIARMARALDEVSRRFGAPREQGPDTD